MQTEFLDIEVYDEAGWIGGQWGEVEGHYGFHGLLKAWFDHKGLEGRGLLIGEQRPSRAVQHLIEKYPEIQTVVTVDLEGSDFDWDITKPCEVNLQADWIICQAVLEHVVDPYGTVQNLLQVLKPNGSLFIHTHGPGFIEHRFPIDCIRFFRDFFCRSNKRKRSRAR